MRVHIFRCSTNAKRFGLTADRTGANLPANACPGGVWTFWKTIDILPNSPLIGVDPQEVIDAINNVGYFIVDIGIVFTERA